MSLFVPCPYFCVSVQVMDNLGSVITRPNFKRWEVKDTHYLLPLERAQAETTPFTVVMEALHKIAYRLVYGPDVGVTQCSVIAVYIYIYCVNM